MPQYDLQSKIHASTISTLLEYGVQASCESFANEHLTWTEPLATLMALIPFVSYYYSLGCRTCLSTATLSLPTLFKQAQSLRPSPASRSRSRLTVVKPTPQTRPFLPTRERHAATPQSALQRRLWHAQPAGSSLANIRPMRHTSRPTTLFLYTD